MAHWYFSSGSNSPRVGPLDDNAAHAHAQQHPEDLCWRDGMAAWKPVGGVLELAPSAQVPAPSMPGLPATGSGLGQDDEIAYRIVGGDTQLVVGRASCRGRWSPSEEISVVDGAYKKK